MMAPVLEPRGLTVAGTRFHLVAPPVPEYVVSSWCSTYRRIAPGKLHIDTWSEGQRRVIRDLMPLVVAVIAPEGPNTIQAWVCGALGVCHYVFVGRELRGLGIASALVREVCGLSGWHTHHKPKELSKAFRGFTFNPYALTDAVRRAQTRRP